MRVIISGGGTGGHIFPALAIADAIKKDVPGSEILFVGAKGRMEMERVPKAGYPIEGLWISGFQRKLSLKNLSFPFKLISSLLKASKILKRFKPDVVIGVGGYASGPTLEMAVRMNIPTLIQEQNSFPGITNRLLGSKVNRICVAFEGLERFFPKDKLVLTGNPVRADLKEMDAVEMRKAAMDFYELDPSKKTILIVGGSLGARTLNEAMKENFELLKSRTDIQVLWQAGKIYEAQFRTSETAQLDQVKLLAFLERMDLAYAAADVVIGRAGALTISELCLLGKPSILVPSPNVAEDHQTKNCKALVAKDAAILVKDSNAGQVIKTALDVLDTKGKAETLSRNILSLALPDATENIVKEIKSLVHRG
ncbi:MAG: undecaprenyldiphospho-muramoylpentapeptide beta-N-acetylglucosaminyltransferase [Saprospiraceae bacterium]|nr:undecaprenyldiphospho-muramoylpentapeptide beta-N-acetylglucosaminyltransferase [Saprospiraceae bacterium]